MKVVLCAVGSRGDLQPLAVLGHALQERGHDVTVCGPPEARTLADERGVPYLSAGRDMMAWIQKFDVATIGMRALFQAFKDLVDKDLHATAPLLMEAAHGADVVVSAGLQVLGRSVAEASGAASTYLYFAPSLLPSDEHPPMVVELQRLPKLANRAFHAVTLAFFNRTVLPALNRERRALGLSPHRDMADAMDRDLTLAYDTALAPAPSDLAHSWRRYQVEPRAVHQVGALVPRGGRIDDALTAFVSERRCVYVGFGSMPDQTPADTMALVDAAARTADVHVVMLGKHTGSERVRVVAEAAHDALFPLLRAVVHHGGSGTTATASRAGVPQVVVPHFVDQPFWAHRLMVRGVSAGSIRRRELTADNLAAAIKRAVTDAGLSERARALAAELAAVDPVHIAADHIEALGAR